MTVREDKAKRQALYDLGWYEDDHDVWRCRSCRRAQVFVECCQCGRCEACGSCAPIDKEVSG